MAELYTRMENYKLKQAKGKEATRYAEQSVQACRNRIHELLEEVGGIKDTRIPVEDARPLAEYFSGIRELPEFSGKPEKAAMVFKAMQAIFKFNVSVKTLAKYFYSKDKELPYLLNFSNSTGRKIRCFIGIIILIYL